MSSSGLSSVRVVPSASLEGTKSKGRETSVSESSHSRIPSPEDARSRRDLEVMKFGHDIASVISEEALESIRECYSIPEGYVLRVPLPEQRPYQPKPSEISFSVDALEAGLRFPLHPTIVECLRWWRISPSQMAPNSWRYLIAFLGECRGAGIVPSRTLFFACFRLFKSREVEGNPSPFLGNPGYDREVVGRGRAQSSFSGCYGSECIAEEAPNAGGKGTPAVGPDGTQPEVEVTHAEASGKQTAGSSVPDKTAIGRPEKRVKIAVRKHKAHRGEGSLHRAAREREPEVSADSSPAYRRPKSTRDLCGMQVREDDEGYYVLQMADWAPRDSSAAMQAR
ncbi:hypothetical protein BHM03_00016220 [Ensete ventricosum]|nr:hypothetical protein BHM03_00016220 [Ensete ventricosum]